MTKRALEDLGVAWLPKHYGGWQKDDDCFCPDGMKQCPPKEQSDDSLGHLAP